MTAKDKKDMQRILNQIFLDFLNLQKKQAELMSDFGVTLVEQKTIVDEKEVNEDGGK